MKLGHVHIKVTDIEKSKQYYRDMFDLRVVEEISGQFVFMSFASAHHDLALQQRDPISGQALDSVLYHIAFEVQDVAALKKIKSRLEANNHRVTPIDHGISWALYTRDPDGIGIEIYLDRREAEGGSARWNGRSKALAI